jgi:hypothetical protein
METKPAFPLRTELLNALDEQIEMLSLKTFASFTNEDRRVFNSREERIRELQQALALAAMEPRVHSGVFAPLYT